MGPVGDFLERSIISKLLVDHQYLVLMSSILDPSHQEFQDATPILISNGFFLGIKG